MATLPIDRITELLGPYELSLDDALLHQLSTYLDLLVKWNTHTNLTSIREPEEMVTRHFGESLFAARHVGDVETFLDYGSGGGFPGLPIALTRREVRVTLAESQNKKAAFLREAVRVLDAKVEVWGRRVESMPAGRRFDCVALRAVDGMKTAVELASRVAGREMLLFMTGASFGELPGGFRQVDKIGLPGSRDGMLLRLERTSG